jgi:hypothetical protein
MTTTPAARRQVLAILSDHELHSWGEINRTVALTHGVPQKDVTSLLRHMVRTSEVERYNPGDREPCVRLPGGGGES